MATFKGRLWLVPDRVSEVSVEIHVDEERIKLTSNKTVIGDWPFSDVNIESRDHDIHIFVEGEELVVWSHDPGFAPVLLRERSADPQTSAVSRASSGRGAHSRSRIRRRRRTRRRRLR